ncbi:MAG: FkbM family methyltransferase [Tannerella sp.]|jgi:FkbM family methyltransferase|nr:FkbM family methyltransferase [Tannerella sp.]
MELDDIFSYNEQPTDLAVIERLKSMALPVVIYGASLDVADQIVKKLIDSQIAVSFVAYDDECPMMAASTVLLKNTSVIHVKDIDSQLSAYNVILGFVKGYSNIPAISLKFRNAANVAYLSEIFDMEIVTRSFVETHRAALEDFYHNLQDQYSKDSFAAYLASKVLQDMRFLPPVFEKTQYFPQGIFELSRDESYFDCGAFTGDTIADFLKATGGSYRHIWAVEPDTMNCNRLTKYINEERLQHVDVVNKGVYSHAGRLPFQETGNMLSMLVDDAQHFIEVDTIDRIATGNPVTYIKMDVEGAEMEALKGAEQTIRKYTPVLGISIYHKQQDLIDIPHYIKSLVPEYTFYFRVHKKLAIDTVLYAVAK